MSAARRLVLAVVSLACAGALAGGGPASAEEPDPLTLTNLRVEGGEDAWHPDNDFRIAWDSPPIPERDLPVAAVLYRIRDAGGEVVVPDTRLPRQLPPIDHIHVPDGPGLYTAELRLEGKQGELGPPGSVSLRFDDTPPGSAQPLAPSGWIAAETPVLARIEHPVGAQPPAGIRGYAVSVDRDAGASPCAAAERCEDSETDLRGGIGDDSISLGVLPQGTSFVHTVAVSGSGIRSAAVGGAVVRVDATLPRVVLDGVPRGWADGPVRLAATAADALSGMAPDGPNGPYTAIAVDDRLPTVAPGDSVSAIVTGEGTHSVAYYGRDAAGNVAGEGQPPAATVRIDETPPRVAFGRAQDPADPERIEASVADRLSGPDPARGVMALRRVGSRQPFEPLPTSVRPGRLTARWDSDAFPPGDYEFRATGYDEAGNPRASGLRDDGARMVLANPLKTPTLLRAGFGGEAPARAPRRTVPYGRAVAFGGRLRSISGAPLAGQPVEVVEAFDAGAGAGRRTTTVETGTDGRFLTRLAPGPSRRVHALFAGGPTLTRAGSGAVRLRSLAGVRLRASAASARVGGAPVIFSGRLEHRAAPIPPGGWRVELQFRLPGLPWTEFRTVQTDARGRFRYPYAFSDDDSRGVRFGFRAFVPAQEDWPYEPAGSRSVSVLGR